MNTKTISTYKAGQQVDATHFLQVATVPCKVFAVEGQAAGAGALYIQLLGTATPVSGTTVPLWSKLITGGTGFSFVYPSGEDTSTMYYPSGTTNLAAVGANAFPVYVAISSTIAVYTSTAVAVDVDVTIDLPFVDLPSQVLAVATAAGSLTVWNDVAANSSKRLVSLTVDNLNNGTDEFLLLFAQTGPSATTVPLASWTVPATSTFTQQFGAGFAMQSSAPVGTLHYGCYFTISTSKQFYVASGDTFNSIKASYIALV